MQKIEVRFTHISTMVQIGLLLHWNRALKNVLKVSNRTLNT